MSEHPDTTQTTHGWYARPVFFVSDVQRSIRFYVDHLGFSKKWHEGDGKGTVCQVDRTDCEIILCQDVKRTDKGRLFISLNRDQFDQLHRELVERSVQYEKSWWGYDVIRVVDPDGNDLLFPIDNEWSPRPSV
jgi:catechol 2,3-dioxygenase-like lactoylglutathione lyase family enzyme